VPTRSAVPTVEVATRPLAEATAPMLVVGAFTAASGERTDPCELAPGGEELAAALDVDLVAELTAGGFDGSVGSTLRVPTRGAVPAASVLVVGLGARDEAGTDQLRRAGAVAAAAGERTEALASSLATAAADVEVEAAAQAVAEGLHQGAYRYTDFRSDPRPFELARVALHVGEDDLEAATSGVATAAVTGRASAFARDLVNTPPQAKRPPELADRVVAEVAELPITARVLDEQALAEGGYGGILGVGQGSSAPPRLVELTYVPEAATRHVALVGKGITFDTGGISLKPSNAMETMKTDMAGAATVAAVVIGAAELGLPVKVTALLALAENMPSGTATRVSDVLTMKGGTTVEVMNTDAEGRLVLGDALVHASELGPDAIVDVATLTGAAVVALGDRIGVVMGSDDELVSGLLAASTGAGEPFWQLPLATREYGDRVEGTIADLRNVGNRAAGTIFAGLFLHRFVGDDLPWAHLDIAGVAWSDDAAPERQKGATGVPVRTLLHWLAAAPPTG
jgi:leucyl aminopeptidase